MIQHSVEVVPMQWFDVVEVAALEAVTYPDDAWSEATWWAELAGRPRRHYVVARPGDATDGPIAGYAGIDINGENADVMTIAVAPQQQGSGLGSLLLSRMHDAACQRGASAVLLEVRADNAAARALYARHDYEQIATRAGYYGGAITNDGRTTNGSTTNHNTTNGAVDAIVMRRVLRRTGESDA